MGYCERHYRRWKRTGKLGPRQELIPQGERGKKTRKVPVTKYRQLARKHAAEKKRGPGAAKRVAEHYGISVPHVYWILRRAKSEPCPN